MSGNDPPPVQFFDILQNKISVLSSGGEFLALISISGPIHQEVWLSSFPYTGTEKWLQWGKIWETTPLKAPCTPPGEGCSPQEQAAAAGSVATGGKAFSAEWTWDRHP